MFVAILADNRDLFRTDVDVCLVHRNCWGEISRQAYPDCSSNGQSSLGCRLDSLNPGRLCLLMMNCLSGPSQEITKQEVCEGAWEETHDPIRDSELAMSY